MKADTFRLHTINAEGDPWHGCLVVAILHLGGRYECAPAQEVIDAIRADDDRNVDTRVYPATALI